MIDQSSNRAWKSFAWAVLLVAVVVALTPYVWMVLASFRPQGEIFADLGLIPTHWTLENYVTGWNFFGNVTFTTFFFNSFVICALAVVGNVLACSLAGYAFGRLEFRWKPFWFAIMIGSLMLPIHAQLIPQYIAFMKIGWVNTILPLVVPKFLATDAFYVFLMVQFMRTLPKELEQAAAVRDVAHHDADARLGHDQAVERRARRGGQRVRERGGRHARHGRKEWEPGPHLRNTNVHGCNLQTAGLS